MKILIIVLSLLKIASPVFSQENGIYFESGLRWDQIKNKARIENKFMFLDVYATWCGPCKAMDKDVYSVKEISALMSNKFISVKIQADSTDQDSEMIKLWYSDAKKIIKEYNINGFPAFLFFSPDGRIVHRSMGYKGLNDFILMIKKSVDPKTQLYTRLEQYRRNPKQFEIMPDLAREAKSSGELILANEIAQNYIDNYLLRQKTEVLLSRENLKFIGDFLVNANTKAFSFFIENREKIRPILTGLDQPEYKLRSIIAAMLPKDLMLKSANPDWATIEESVSSKFGDLGKEVVDGRKMIFYLNKMDWSRFGKYYVEYFNKAYKRPEFNINAVTWPLFGNVKDTAVLRFACDTVMKYAIEEWYQNDPASWDTYANLLYKIGKTGEAIEWEEKAVKIKKGQLDEKPYLTALEKMRKGLPTWEVATNNN